MNPKIDSFFEKAPRWQEEMAYLRTLTLDCGLKEELKWGKPCYTLNDANIVIIQGFKEYCALLFFKGVLLKDPHKILIKTGENTHISRQARFTSIEQIAKIEPLLKNCIQEAIEVEKAGLKVPEKVRTELEYPEEFQQILEEDAKLKAAFEALTPGRQKAYIFFFLQAKQPQTRITRIEKKIPQILAGKGLNEQ